jgi:hypothetical protein
MNNKEIMSLKKWPLSVVVRVRVLLICPQEQHNNATVRTWCFGLHEIAGCDSHYFISIMYVHRASAAGGPAACAVKGAVGHFHTGRLDIHRASIACVQTTHSALSASVVHLTALPSTLWQPIPSVASGSLHVAWHQYICVYGHLQAVPLRHAHEGCLLLFIEMTNEDNTDNWGRWAGRQNLVGR